MEIESKSKQKLDVRELRIGNTVWLGDGETRVDINLLRDFSLIGHLHEPIPLTEEWLVKMGFECTGDRCNKEASNGLFRVWVWGFFGEEYHIQRIGEKRGDLEIKHVHQLQNLYFALNGEELTIEL